MQMSLYPPHHWPSERKPNLESNIALPFCYYDSVESNGKSHRNDFDPYGQTLCREFKPSFDEHGLCYSFNSLPQGFADIFDK